MLKPLSQIDKDMLKYLGKSLTDAAENSGKKATDAETIAAIINGKVFAVGPEYKRLGSDDAKRKYLIRAAKLWIEYLTSFRTGVDNKACREYKIDFDSIVASLSSDFQEAITNDFKDVVGKSDASTDAKKQIDKESIDKIGTSRTKVRSFMELTLQWLIRHGCYKKKAG